MAIALMKTIISLVVLLQTVISQDSIDDSTDYCVDLADAISICNYETPGFTELPATDQVSCLCADNLYTIPWGPATFDAMAAACAIQYATIDDNIAYDASQLAGFCTDPAPQPVTQTIESIVTTTLSPSSNDSPAVNIPGTVTTPTQSLGSISPPITQFVTTTPSPITPTTSSSANSALKFQWEIRRFLDLGLVLTGLTFGIYMMA